MKFYTLTYDCNKPTTQQINVPTNTNYKVGIKVLRNGKEQNLKPAEVTLGALSADEGDINGYLTFTGKTGDEASYAQETLDIQHGFDDAVVEYFSKQNTGSSALSLNGELSATAESLGLTGKTVDAENFYIGAVRSASTEPTNAEVLSTLENPFYSDNALFQNRFPVRKANGGYILISVGPSRNLYLDEAKARGQYKDGDGAVFFYSPDSTGENWYPRKTYTFEADDVISLGWGKLQAGKWCKYCIDMNFGTPFDAKFKLTTNVFKSQEGNIGAFTGNVNTVNFAGQTVDGTDFSYNFVLN